MNIPSISFKVNVSSNIRELLGLPPRPRPRQVPLRKHVSWRLKKKWFNRYQKPYMMKQRIYATYKSGQQIVMKPIDIKLVKQGGRSFGVDFKTESI